MSPLQRKVNRRRYFTAITHEIDYLLSTALTCASARVCTILYINGARYSHSTVTTDKALVGAFDAGGSSSFFFGGGGGSDLRGALGRLGCECPLLSDGGMEGGGSGSKVGDLDSPSILRRMRCGKKKGYT